LVPTLSGTGRKKRVEAKSYPASSREAEGTKTQEVAVGKADEGLQSHRFRYYHSGLHFPVPRIFKEKYAM